MADNTGSFGAALGGIDALKASMQSRGIDTSVLDQVSAAAPGEQAAPGQVPTTNPNAGFDQRQLAARNAVTIGL